MGKASRYNTEAFLWKNKISYEQILFYIFALRLFNNLFKKSASAIYIYIPWRLGDFFRKYFHAERIIYNFFTSYNDQI